jgi:hypothetical protein
VDARDKPGHELRHVRTRALAKGLVNGRACPPTCA